MRPGDAQRLLDTLLGVDAPVGFAVFDENLRYMEVNAALARHRGRTASALAELDQVGDGVVEGHVDPITRAAVLHLDHTVGQPAADHDDRRHPEELRVLELHSRGDAASIVVDHSQAGRFQRRGQGVRRVKLIRTIARIVDDR